MSAGIYDLYIEQGTDWVRNCQYKDVNGDPVDLTGCTLQAQIRRTYSDPTIAATISVTILNQASPANLGKFVLTLSASQTAAIAVNQAVNFETPNTNYCYDVILTKAGQTQRLLQGAVYLNPEVTQ